MPFGAGAAVDSELLTPPPQPAATAAAAAVSAIEILLMSLLLTGWNLLNVGVCDHQAVPRGPAELDWISRAAGRHVVVVQFVDDQLLAGRELDQHLRKGAEIDAFDHLADDPRACRV